MSISRTEVSQKVFEVLAAYVDSGDSKYSYDIQKCYIDFQEEDKADLNTIHDYEIQEFIPNAKFAITNYKGIKILIVVGEQINLIDDNILIDMELDLSLLLFAIYFLEIQVDYSKSPIQIFNDILCQPEDEAYHGHCLSDLENAFEKIAIYQIIEDSSIVNDNVYAPYTYYLLKKSQEHPNKWAVNTLDTIERILLSGNKKIPYHNIALALLANQWNHSFLESYRCIEHLFQVIELEPLHNTLQTTLTLSQVSREIEDKISWRPNEEVAIRDIFKEIEHLHIATDLETVKIKYAGDMRVEKWYYNQRNAIAHYRAIHEPLRFSNEEWDTLIYFNFLVIEYLYEKYKEKI